MGTVIFPCGCKFETIDPNDTNTYCVDQQPSSLPPLKIDFSNIPQNCPATYQMLHDGYTKGIFQLEGHLGKLWSKKIKPKTIDDLGDLVALIRPGCTKAKSGDPPKSMTQRYCDRKNGIEDIDYYHEELKDILSNTQGVLCVHQDTHVAMLNGSEKKIKDIQVNDMVYCVNRANNRLVPRRCLNVGPTRKTYGIRLRLTNGMHTIFTKDHKVLTQRGMIRVDELDVDNDLVAVAKHGRRHKVNCIYINKEFGDTPEHLCYLLGLIVGSQNKDKTRLFPSSKGNIYQLAEKLNKWFPNLIFTPHLYDTHCEYYLSINFSNDEDHIKFMSLLRKTGILDNRVPKSLFAARHALRYSFLAGVYESCGSTETEKYAKPQSYLNIADINKGRKNLANELRNDIRKLLSINNIPCILEHGVVIPGTVVLHKFINKYTVCRKMLNNNSAGNGIYTRAHNYVGFVPISYRERVGISQFYGMTVDEHHNFIANGMIVSNCYQEQAMQIAQKIAGFDMQQADVLRKCVTDDTKFVSKSRGWISIKQLLKDGYDNDLFLTMNANGKQQWKKIEKIWCTGKQNVKTITTKSGLSVTTTEYHQLLTDQGWKAQKCLQVGDYLIGTKNISYCGFDILPEKFVMLIASLLCGEMYFNNGKLYIKFNNKKSYILAKMNFKDNDYDINATDLIIEILPDTQKRIEKILNIKLTNIYHSIPKYIVNASNTITKNCLSLLLAAKLKFNDKAELVYQTESNEFAKQLQLLLFRYNITSYIDNNKLIIHSYESKCIIYHQLSSYWQHGKRNDLENKLKLVSKPEEIPLSLVKRFYQQYPYISTEVEVLSSRDHFTRIADIIGDPYWQQIAYGNQQYSEITHVSGNHPEITYDFTIEGNDTPYIIANGLVIHNSIGKKKADLMAKVKTQFIDGCKQTNKVNEQEAQEIFGWIQESQKYSFNKSHAISYGINAYNTAYAKAHFGLWFFVSYLRGSHWKQSVSQEIKELVNEAKQLNIEICKPDLRHMQRTFYEQDGKIFFGLNDIRGVGSIMVDKLFKLIYNIENKLNKQLSTFSWLEYLIYIAPYISSIVNVSLISSGALDYYGIPRKQMLKEYESIQKLTAKEFENIYKKFNHEWSTVTEMLYDCCEVKKNGGICSNVNRVKKLRDLIIILNNNQANNIDDPEWLSFIEDKYLGVSLSCLKIDACAKASDANHTCKEISDGATDYSSLAVEIDRYKVITTKNGDLMCFATVSDHSGVLDNVVIFPEAFAEFKGLIYNENTVLLIGELSKDKHSFLVQRIKQI